MPDGYKSVLDDIKPKDNQGYQSVIPDLTKTEDILKLAKTGELPKVVSKQREQEPKPPKIGMGDLKVAESYKSPLEEYGITPPDFQQTSEHHPTSFEEAKMPEPLGQRITQIGESLTDKRKKVERIRQEAQNELRQGNIVNYLNKNFLGDIESINYLGQGISYPFSVGSEVLKEVPIAGEPTANAISTGFEKIGDVGKFLTQSQRSINDFVGIKNPDKETQDAIDELASLVSQFVIPAGVLGLMKGKLTGLPKEQIKDVVKSSVDDIKQNIDLFKPVEQPVPPVSRRMEYNPENPFAKTTVIQEPVYHGTNRSFNEFKTEPFGTHFGKLDIAEQFSDAWSPEHTPNIHKNYIDIKKPIFMDDVGGFAFAEPVILNLYERGYLTTKELLKYNITPELLYKWRDEMIQPLYEKGMSSKILAEVKKDLQAKGYDGVIYRNTVEGINGDQSYIVFDKNQIKSAISEKSLNKPINLPPDRPIESAPVTPENQSEVAQGNVLKPPTTETTPEYKSVIFGENLKGESKVFDYQDSNPEKIIHAKWNNGNQFRYILEGSGDILRELSARGDNPDFYSKSYVGEKINRIENFLDRMDMGIGTSEVADGSRLYSKKFNEEHFKNLQEAYEKQPTSTVQQDLAKQLTLDLIKGDWESARRSLNDLKEFNSKSEVQNAIENGNRIEEGSQQERLKREEEERLRLRNTTQNRLETPTGTEGTQTGEGVIIERFEDAGRLGEYYAPKGEGYEGYGKNKVEAKINPNAKITEVGSSEQFIKQNNLDKITDARLIRDFGTDSWTEAFRFMHNEDYAFADHPAKIKDAVEYTKKVYREAQKLVKSEILKSTPDTDIIKFNFEDEVNPTQYLIINKEAITNIPKGTSGTLQSQILPFSKAGKVFRAELEQSKKDVQEVKTAVDKTMNLYRKATGWVTSDVGKLTKQTLREQVANLDFEKQLTEQQFNKLKAKFNSHNLMDFLDIVDIYEKGRQGVLDKPTQDLIGEMKRLSKIELDQLQKIDPNLKEVAEYFPHLFKKPVEAELWMKEQLKKQKFSGRAGFLKNRYWELFSDAVLKGGFEPLTTNFVEMWMTDRYNKQKFIMKHTLVNQMRDLGLTRYYKYSEKLKAYHEGYIPINDGALDHYVPKTKLKKLEDGTYKEVEVKDKDTGEPVMERRQTYIPIDSGIVFNNYLSKGLSQYPIYRGMRMLGNTLNQIQLGMSAFHLAFTTQDAIISRASLGIQTILGGIKDSDFKQMVRGAKLLGSTPVSGATTILKGDVLKQMALHPEQPLNNWRSLVRKTLMKNISDPQMSKMIEDVVKSGGRFKSDGVYFNRFTEKFKQDFVNDRLVRAIFHGVGSVPELIAKPIMEMIVPRQKLGVFMEMARELENQRNAKGWSDVQFRENLQKAWDSVDNRMGQMIYDNLFWHKVIKDIGFGSIRSLGWNLGTIREIGGGLYDWGLQTSNAFRKGRQFQITPRMAYVVALPMVIAMEGAVIGYLSGNPPQELKDYFFPKLSNGTRVSLPSYMKDVSAVYQQGITKTALHKLHPTLSILADMLQNEDYYGYEITPNYASLPEKIKDWLSYLETQTMPFSARNLMQFSGKQGGWKDLIKAITSGKTTREGLMSFFGVTPAPKYITNTKFQNEVSDLFKIRVGGTKTLDQLERSNMKKEVYDLYKSGDHFGAIDRTQELLDEGSISKQEANSMLGAIGQPTELRQYQHLPEQDQRHLLEKYPEMIDELLPLSNHRIKEEYEYEPEKPKKKTKKGSKLELKEEFQ